MTTQFKSFVSCIAGQIESHLPGEDAHLEFSPIGRKKSSLYLEYVNPKISAVTLLLFELNEEPHFLLIQRQEYNGNHSGEICFPGGKKDEQDENIFATAKRECEEETGIPSQFLINLGNLTDVYIPVSNHLVHPFVCYLKGNPTPFLQPDEREVKNVIICPVKRLFESDVKSTISKTWSNGKTTNDIPCFIIQGKVVWGATAIILNEFRWMVRNHFQRFYSDL